MSELELRPVTLDLAEALCALTNRAEQADGLPRVLTVEELLEDLTGPDIDPALDACVAFCGDALVGWAYVWNPRSDVGQERAYLHGAVDPAHRGRGVGRAVLSWSLARAEARLRSRQHDLPRYIRVDAYDWMDANHRLYARYGFEPVRWFEELVRPLADLPPVVVPEGVELLPWPDDRDEELRAVLNTAFADHWGTTPTGPDAWHQATRGHGARADLSAIAVDRATGAAVALSLNHAYPEDDELTGRREAWIADLATLRPWRGRGVASALIARSLGAFAAAGFTHAMLGVDSANPTGAARLYRDLGFTTERRSITRQIEVTV